MTERLSRSSRRVALALASGVAVFLAVYAVASAMGFASHDLAAGDEAVTTCDANGFTVDGFTYDVNGLITDVTIGDIDPPCIGGQLTVHLTSSTHASVGSGAAPVSGSPLTVPVSGGPHPDQVKHEVIIIVGP
jgi:hypothetical protein